MAAIFGEGKIFWKIAKIAFLRYPVGRKFFFFVLIVFISAYYKCTYHLIQSRLKQAINDLI